MRQIAFAEVKDHLSKYLVEAGKEQIVITKHGKPAGVLSGFELENDPRFLKRIEQSRAQIRAGQGIDWERIKKEDDERTSASSSRRISRRK
ncbi:MAG: type II toxin-antitoxin system Phd/YefM family antitoxin [Planctomycetota bacterium]